MAASVLEANDINYVKVLEQSYIAAGCQFRHGLFGRR